MWCCRAWKLSAGVPPHARARLSRGVTCAVRRALQARPDDQATPSRYRTEMQTPQASARDTPASPIPCSGVRMVVVTASASTRHQLLLRFRVRRCAHWGPGGDRHRYACVYIIRSCIPLANRYPQGNAGGAAAIPYQAYIDTARRATSPTPAEVDEQQQHVAKVGVACRLEQRVL